VNGHRTIDAIPLHAGFASGNGSREKFAVSIDSRKEIPMATYPLLFDATGKNPENFNVPKNKRLYLVRAPQVKDGTATVQNLLDLTTWELEDGVTVLDTGVSNADVSLVFLERSNQDITLINAEVISPR
jgi:hypothetical protein